MRLPPELKRLCDQVSASTRGRGWELTLRVVNVAAIIVSVAWFIGLFQVNLLMIAERGPQEVNEPSIWHATYLLDHGRNPYSKEELPGSALCFAPFYNFVVLAFKPLLGIDYSAHRTVNLIFLLASLALVVRAVGKAGAGLGIGLLMAVFYYWMSLGNIEMTARPDTLGLFLFLVGILIPWERHYSRPATLFGLGCAVLAFHCKFYFAVAGCATLLGVFFCRSKMEGIRLGVLYFAALGLSFLAMCFAFPYLYIETVVVQRGAAALNSSDEISDMHTVMLFERGWPFMVALGLGLALWLGRRWRARRRAIAGSDAGRALGPEEVRLIVLGAALWIFFALVYFYMGRNAGAYFTYHLHLLFPLMFVFVGYAVNRPWLRVSFGLLLIFFVSNLMTITPGPKSTAPYQHMEDLIQKANGDVLGIASQTDIFERFGRRVLHNGSTMFLGSAFADNGAGRDPMIGFLQRKFDEIEAEVARKVAAREYVLIFSEFDLPYYCAPELLAANYDRVEQIDYYTYFGHSPVRVWRPKPRDSVAPVAP